MKTPARKTSNMWLIFGALIVVIALGGGACLSGCAAAIPAVEPQPLPPNARVTVQYDQEKRVAVVSVDGVTARRVGVWYPGRMEILDRPPFAIHPEAEFVRFNFTFDQVTDQGVKRPFALLTEHSAHENPRLLGPGVSILCSRNGECDLLVDMGPLLAPISSPTKPRVISP